jgi:hypothetical protein
MNFDNLDTGTLMQYLPGVDFPAEKESRSPQAPRATTLRKKWSGESGTEELTVTTIQITCWRPCGDGASFRNILGRQ